MLFWILFRIGKTRTSLDKAERANLQLVSYHHGVQNANSTHHTYVFVTVAYIIDNIIA